MPKTWEEALTAYRYPVKILDRPFKHESDYPGWRHPNLEIGNQGETKTFEDYFRESGPSAINPWAEVVFWKMASQGGRADIQTREVLDRWRGFTSPEILWKALTAYVTEPTKERFNDFRKLFGYKTEVIAIAATFPAFAQPDLFPMVDTRIAKWVRDHIEVHNLADPGAPRLAPTGHDRGLTMRDFTFMHHWTLWCRYTASKLNALTATRWRARDVEMAVFQAQGDSRNLSPLPSVVMLTDNHSLTPLAPH